MHGTEAAVDHLWRDSDLWSMTRITGRSLCATFAAWSLLACTSSTETHAPVASVAITPAYSAVVKGASQTLTASLLDSSRAPTVGAVTWTTSAPTVATVSEAGVVSTVGYGVATILVSAGGKSAKAEVVVTAPPITNAYSVVDLTPIPVVNEPTTYLNDSGQVLAGLLYRNGVGTAVPGCTAYALNNRSHVLCQVGASASFYRYALWRDGVLTPIAASDTFTANAFTAIALNDSDVVAGLYYQPAFANSKCLASGGRCAVLWKDGQPTFPGLYEQGSGWVLYLNNKLTMAFGYPPGNGTLGSSYLYDVQSGQRRPLPGLASAINESGWAAIERLDIIHGAPTEFRYTAMVARPDTNITLGSGGATGINDAGVVTGTLFAGPFLWADGVMSPLAKAATDPGWTIKTALRINNRGQILAKASHVDGRTDHWVVLTPVAR
jgi:hypothetical protein